MEKKFWIGGIKYRAESDLMCLAPCII